MDEISELSHSLSQFIADQEASDNSMTPTLLPLSMRSCHTKSEIKGEWAESRTFS